MELQRVSKGMGPRFVVFLGILAAVALLPGCDCDEDEFGCCGPDGRAPSRVQGFWSASGDERIELFWTANTEFDLDGYRIFRSTEPDGYFPRLVTVGSHSTGFVDHDVRNGVTYYYAIAAFDDDGNESELNGGDDVHETPRPDGRDLRLNNARLDPDDAGYDFSERRTVTSDDLEADVYYWHSEEEGAWMVATERSEDDYSDIQDAGYIPLDEIEAAPEDGWAPAGEVPLIAGHSYVVWTWDNHFAKFRVVSLTPNRVVMDWAYQLDRGNPELQKLGGSSRRHAPGGGSRQHERGMERRIPS